MKMFKLEPLSALIKNGEFDKIHLITVFGMSDEKMTVEEILGKMNLKKLEGWMEGMMDVRDGYATLKDPELYLEDDYKTIEANRKKASYYRKKVSGESKKVSGEFSGEISGEFSGEKKPKKVSGEISGEISGETKMPRNRDFSQNPAGEGKHIYINKENIYIDNDGRQEGRSSEGLVFDMQAFDLLWKSWPVGKQGRDRMKAIDAFKEAGLTMELVKSKCIPAIEALKVEWQNGTYVCTVETFIKNRLYEGVTIKKEEPKDLTVDEAMKMHEENIKRFREENKGKLSLVQQRALEIQRQREKAKRGDDVL